MHVSHHEKGFQYTDKDFLRIVKRVGKLATYCKRVKDDGSMIRIDAERRDGTQKARDQYKVSVTINLPNQTIRAESRKETVREAADRAIAKVTAPLKRYKEQYKREPTNA